jgi:hypothetical protein
VVDREQVDRVRPRRPQRGLAVVGRRLGVASRNCPPTQKALAVRAAISRPSTQGSNVLSTVRSSSSVATATVDRH